MKKLFILITVALLVSGLVFADPGHDNDKGNGHTSHGNGNGYGHYKDHGNSGGGGGGGHGPGHPAPEITTMEYYQNASAEGWRDQSGTYGWREQGGISGALDAISGRIDCDGYESISAAIVGGAQESWGKVKQEQGERANAGASAELSKKEGRRGPPSFEQRTNYNANAETMDAQTIKGGSGKQINGALSLTVGESRIGPLSESYLALTFTIGGNEAYGGDITQYNEGQAYSNGYMRSENGRNDNYTTAGSSTSIRNYMDMEVQNGSAEQQRVTAAVNAYETRNGSTSVAGMSISAAAQYSSTTGSGQASSYQAANTYNHQTVSVSSNGGPR